MIFQSSTTWWCRVPEIPFFHSTFGMLHFEKSSNMAKIWQKTNKSASMVLRVPEPRGSSPRSATSMYDTSSQHWLTKTKIMSWHNLFNPCIFTSDAVKNLWEGLFRMLGVGLFFQSKNIPTQVKNTLKIFIPISKSYIVTYRIAIAYVIWLELGLFGTLKLALALQFIVTNTYFSVARTLILVLHERLL